MVVAGNPRVFIPMHRGADNFMSEEAFTKFYWPTFKALIEALVAAGLTPMPLFEGGTRRDSSTWPNCLPARSPRTSTM